MAFEKIPWDLMEEILSWVPVTSLVGFRTVCKRWNALFDDKRFANNHLARACQSHPQFILFSESKTCSVEVINLVDGVPSIKVRKLPIHNPEYRHWACCNVDYCDGLLLWFHGDATVWNPWLKQTKRAHFIGFEIPDICGIGYDTSRPDSHHKIFVSSCMSDHGTVTPWITELGSGKWNMYEFDSKNWQFNTNTTHGVSLKGTLYWVAFTLGPRREYFIQSFDFSLERFKPFCVLPGDVRPYCGDYDLRSISVFRGDRFSYFVQSFDDNIHIEIWVTKKKINNEEVVEWIKLMNVLVSDSSQLKIMVKHDPPSYFIDHKTGSLVLCYYDYQGQAYIYIAKGDKFFDIKIESMVDYEPRHCTYLPSLVQVPLYQKESEEIQVL